MIPNAWNNKTWNNKTWNNKTQNNTNSMNNTNSVNNTDIYSIYDENIVDNLYIMNKKSMIKNIKELIKKQSQVCSSFIEFLRSGGNNIKHSDKNTAEIIYGCLEDVREECVRDIGDNIKYYNILSNLYKDDINSIIYDSIYEILVSMHRKNISKELCKLYAYINTCLSKKQIKKEI